MGVFGQKRFGLVLAGIVGAALIGWLLLPFFVSTEVVRNAIERNIAEVTGQQVSVGDRVNISLFPTPTARLTNITVAARGPQAQAMPIAVLEEIELDLALNSLITGQPRVKSVRLIRPVFNLEIDPENALSDQLPLNNVRQAVRIAGEQRDAERAQNTDQPADLGTRPQIVYPAWLEQNVGTVTISEGSLVLTTTAQDRTITVSSINGVLNWPRISAPLTFTSTMIVDGQALDVAYTSTHPVDALAGEVAQSTLKVTSPIANLNVSGEFGFASGFFATGTISLETASVRKLLAWGGRPILAGRSLGDLQLSAQMRARGETVRLNDLQIDVAGNAGTGVLEIARRGDNPPTLAGTLDFATLDLRAFLSAFTNLPRSTNTTSTIDTSFMQQLQTDLRISATTARFDELELTGVAATAQTTADLALFDLGDASAFNGALQARLRFDRNPQEPTIEFNISGQDIDMAAAISTLNLPRVLPNGLNNFNWTMTAALGDWADLLENARGKVTMRQAGGAIAGFGPSTLEASNGLQFTQVDTAVSGAAFESFVLDAPIIDGELKLDEAIINYNDTTNIALNGVVQLASRSMALTARLDKTAEQQNQPRYFIGGGWDAPYIFGTLEGPPLPTAPQ